MTITAEDEDEYGGAEVPRERYQNRIGPDTQVSRWFDHIVNGLTLAGVIALVAIVWNLSQTATELRTLVKYQGLEDDRRFTTIDTTLERHDQRITTLEREQRIPLAQPDYRQKRQ